MSISWAGLTASLQGSQHQERQLGRLGRHFGREASIMSISWAGLGGISAGKPASSASASIMSISWAGFGGISAGKHEHQVWAACRQGSQHHEHQLGRLAQNRQGSQHHEYELGRVGRDFWREASIMSISWAGLGGMSAGKPAS